MSVPTPSPSDLVQYDPQTWIDVPAGTTPPSGALTMSDDNLNHIEAGLQRAHLVAIAAWALLQTVQGDVAALPEDIAKLEQLVAGKASTAALDALTESTTTALATKASATALSSAVAGLTTPVQATALAESAAAAAVSALIDGAPDAANTLRELKELLDANASGDAATAAALSSLITVVAGKATPADITTAVNGLAAVARTGSYTDLLNKPTIPAAPDLTPYLTRSDASATYEQKAIRALEAVPLTVYGDSYGQGAQGADQVSRPFNRLAVRHNTQAPTVQAVAGTRMDQIAARIASTWAPNARGLVGFADGCINDEKQYGDNTGIPTTREAFRTCLAYLTAAHVAGPSTVAFVFDSNWNAGASSTAGAVVDFAWNGDTAHLLVGFVTGAGGTLTITNNGTTVATVSTGGYKQAFTGALRLAGFGAGYHSLRATLTTGSATIVGIAAASPTPPVIVWDKPGQMNTNAAEQTRLSAYLAACAAILADYPTVVAVDMGTGWDYPTMISAEDSTHRNDLGNLYALDRIEAALRTYLAAGPRQGLNRLSAVGSGPVYTVPAAPGAPAVYAADGFSRTDSASPGSTESGSLAWAAVNSGTWSTNGSQLVSAATATTAPNDCLVDDGRSDGTISARLTSAAGSRGIAFRISGTGNVNGYLAWSNGGVLTLSKRTGTNAYTALGTGGATVAQGDVIAVVLNGSSIVVKQNGTAAITVTDASYTGTKHGFWTNGTGGGATAATFDDFQHTAAVA